MKFICATTLMSDACQNVQRAVSTKNAIPALEGIYLKALGNEVILTGYDLEVGINTSVTAMVDENGGIVLNARVLCDILRKLPGETVEIKSDERHMAVITCGNAVFSLVGISPKEYPELPSVTGGFPIVISQELLREMIRQTIFAVATSDTKVVHTGIKFEISENLIKLIAVDGFRLAIRKEAINYSGEFTTFIVPSKTLSEAVKLFGSGDETISISVGKKHLIFEIGSYSVVSRLLDGEFLNYNSAIPVECATKVKVETRSFIDSLERISLIITDKIKSPIRCAFKDNNINVSSTTALGSANDAVSASIEGADLDIGFNNRFLIEALRVCDTDEVNIKLNGSVAPILILPPQGDSFLFLILPVRLKSDV